MKTGLLPFTLCLCLVFVSKAIASDVSPNYFIIKDQRFYQSSTAAPVLSSTSTQGAPYRVTAFVEATSTTSIISATISSGASAPIALANADDGFGDFKGSAQYNDVESMNAAYSGETYDLSGTGAGGPFDSGAMTISGTFSPNVPTVTNTSWVDGDLLASSTSALTLTWDSLSDATASDLILLQVTDQTTGLLEDDILFSGTAVSDTVPALPPGLYKASILYGVVTGTSDFIAGAVGYSGYANEDRFNIESVPEPSTWAEMALSLGGLAFLAKRRRLGSR